MLKWFVRILAVLVLAFCLTAAYGGVLALLRPEPPLRGERIDIGGRRLRVVCEGPVSDRPLVVMESGIYGVASDWGEVQRRLTAAGFRSCAYDRAGLGWSDPGPQPRLTPAMVDDIEAWLRVKGETGPLILVGHSMAGFSTRLFTYRHPDRVAGLVLVDAANPDMRTSSRVRRLIRAVGAAARTIARFGLLKPFAAGSDAIGLDGPAHEEKLFLFGAVNHNLGAAAEARSIMASADLMRGAGRLDPALPVAAITAGPQDGGVWSQGRVQAARQSRHGWIRNLPKADHASLLGRTNASVIVSAVEHVAAAAKNR